MEISRSPGRTPARAAGELGANFQACAPPAVSSQATPSSGLSKVSRWTKLSQAKIIAASVASASTTAPTLTLRFCFMTEWAGTHLPLINQVQTDVHCFMDQRTRNRNIFIRLGAWRENQAAVILFLEGCLQLSDA